MQYFEIFSYIYSYNYNKNKYELQSSSFTFSKEFIPDFKLSYFCVCNINALITYYI
jgi:hypothetical protein